MPEVPATILGGLPVVVDVHFGMTDDENGKDYWSEVHAIYWQRRDGSKGKPIPQHLFDRAEAQDPCFAALTEDVSEQLAGPPDDEMVAFDLESL